MKKALTIIGITIIIAGVVWAITNSSQGGDKSDNAHTSASTAIAVGSPFSDFSVTEIDGRKITRDSLKGKPVIVWFTTEFCVPCQIGARKVSELDDELGGSAFDVLVVFVDPRETEEDLRSWRERFARGDWMVAFDNFESNQDSLSAKVGLKYLDSKYLLDADGIIQDIDFQVADGNYLELIRSVVENS